MQQINFLTKSEWCVREELGTKEHARFSNLHQASSDQPTHPKITYSFRIKQFKRVYIVFALMNCLP
jgi:hypothetical protein